MTGGQERKVATGRPGLDAADEVLRSVASSIGCQPSDIVLASTGVIISVIGMITECIRKK